MDKAYLFAYDDELGSREQVKQYLNAIPEISRWRYDMPNTFYIISNLSAVGLTEKLRAQTGEKGKFVFTEFAGNEQGWLTEASWYLITNKQYKPK